jgi:electron transfer flavoprotein alpha subunit
MKALLICEYREGKLLDSSYELAAFADKLGADKAMVLIGSEPEVPRINGKTYLADAAKYGEYNPDLHKRIVLEAVKKENPDYIVFLHSSYGWDLAPRVAAALKAGQVSEITSITPEGKFEVGLCNAKLRRIVTPKTGNTVLTIQSGAFTPAGEPQGKAQLEKIELTDVVSGLGFIGYEPAQKKEVDLTRAEVIVSAGRGVGKKENVPIIDALAKALGGVLGASRPVVDAGWVEHSRQVGTTGQTVAPKLYVACGISGAIQHIAGMKKSEFVVAINKDKDAPIGEVADVLVVADVMQFVPAFTAKLQK